MRWWRSKVGRLLLIDRPLAAASSGPTMRRRHAIAIKKQMMTYEALEILRRVRGVPTNV